MNKLKKELIVALTSVVVSVLLGVLFSKNKNALKKVAGKGKEKFKKVKEDVSEYADNLQDKAQNAKRQI